LGSGYTIQQVESGVISLKIVFELINENIYGNGSLSLQRSSPGIAETGILGDSSKTYRGDSTWMETSDIEQIELSDVFF
jgi:hypothetical protein